MSWADSLKGVGQAYLELLRSEIAALRDDLAATGRRVGGLLLLLAVAAFLLFWALGVLVYLMIEILALWLPRWGATLTVLLLLVAVVAALAVVARRRWSATELPAQTFRRRLDGHVDWWESRILERSLDASPEASDGAEETVDRREMKP
jgi:hypothetical protein